MLVFPFAVPVQGTVGRSFVSVRKSFWKRGSPFLHLKRLYFTQTSEAMEKVQDVEEGEEQAGASGKVYVHYDHTLPSLYPRWTARESFRFMHDRPWQEVRDFYSNLVNGQSSLSVLFGNELVQEVTEVPECFGKAGEETAFKEDRVGRWARKTFKIVVSYHGTSFDGWQKQPGLNTVQGLIEKSLGAFVDEKKAKMLKEKHLPLEGCAVVAGRTDKGVTALRQICSFYTWREDVKPQDIKECIDSAAPGKLRVVSVSEVPREFHPNFTAKWRRYLYIFPLNDGEDEEVCGTVDDDKTLGCHDDHAGTRNGFHDNIVNGKVLEDLILCDGDDKDGTEIKRRKFDIARVDMFLRQLEGKILSYKMFARDTKASRNIGPPTECFMYHARAGLAHLRCMEERKVMCIELVANRFLRKMVRVLVATAIREAAAGAEEEVLVKLMDSTCRRATAPPAAPDGLCLVDVGYSDFNPRNCCLIVD
ncbi:hypothetical protein SAY86_023578 [Trapa natans]|uniref:tRNA pseudouridine synthase n=1 Tax=Trapa natans TaxID=22666 RepID=A0AAN7RBM6_TRANT|nr:hypothetical protein SAY86_023578 [Trapa natans]